jgi:type VI protein secretion system component VasK
MSDPVLIALILLAIGSIALWRLPSGSCPHCWHCKQQRLERAQQRRDAEDEAVRRRKREAHMMFHKSYGRDGCPYCEEHDAEG